MDTNFKNFNVWESNRCFTCFWNKFSFRLPSSPPPLTNHCIWARPPPPLANPRPVGYHLYRYPPLRELTKNAFLFLFLYMFETYACTKKGFGDKLIKWSHGCLSICNLFVVVNGKACFTFNSRPIGLGHLDKCTLYLHYSV